MPGRYRLRLAYSQPLPPQDSQWISASLVLLHLDGREELRFALDLHGGCRHSQYLRKAETYPAQPLKC